MISSRPMTWFSQSVSYELERVALERIRANLMSLVFAPWWYVTNSDDLLTDHEHLVY